jgi:spore maturation protein CgeB
VSLYCNLESGSKILLKKSAYLFYKTLRYTGMDFIIDRIPVLKKRKSYGEIPVREYSSELKKASHTPVFGMELFRLMAKAKITFNNHGEIAGKCAGNIRMFEVTGSGSCLLTDWKENISELFEPGKEIVTYTSVEDCIEKAEWLLKNPEECRRIAAAGQARTLRDHTVRERVKMLNRLIEGLLMNTPDG